MGKNKYPSEDIMYKRSINQVVKMIANAKSAHMRNEIMENMNNPKRLWKTLLKNSTNTADSFVSFLH